MMHNDEGGWSMLENETMSVDLGGVTVAQLPRTWVPPTVYRPQQDSALIATALLHEGVAGRDVLDLCTGSGVLAMTAATLGAARVVAVDISRAAVLTTRLNAWRNRLSISVHRGNFDCLPATESFDIIVSNPPYVPASSATPGAVGAQRWDAGDDGRSVLDPLCDRAFDLLRPGGTLLVVQSEFSGEARTLERLQDRVFDATTVQRTRIPFGPVLSSRRPYLRDRGLCEPNCDEEELIVIRGKKTLKVRHTGRGKPD
ncbi:HemK2/MTQ2 family protein methyltransferase [Antrihabitans spumae]|uniref:HemK2/MTQ2 family protein methyltransferase n=1 Tax=Antrihabitans spumae TaxID=3373370 RepID=A0ABW7KXW7_9NOCA